MSEWRDIWKKALVANRKFLITKNYEKSGFCELIKQFPEDGMVRFDLAISYDFLNDKEKAIDNYKKAEMFFPVKHWQNIAKLYRIKLLGENPVISGQWSSFYEFHSFVYLPEDIRYKSISSISKIDSEAVETIISFRVSLERSLKLLLGISLSEDTKLMNIIDEAKNKYVRLKDLSDEIKQIKDAGDIAIHSNSYSASMLNENLMFYTEIMQTINDLLFENKMFGLE